MNVSKTIGVSRTAGRGDVDAGLAIAAQIDDGLESELPDLGECVRRRRARAHDGGIDACDVGSAGQGLLLRGLQE